MPSVIFCTIINTQTKGFFMKIGLIGCGGMGTTHNLSLKALSEKKDLQVVAIADCRPEKLEQATKLWPQARRYASGMELLQNEDLNMADICLPSYLHADHAVAALQKGMHVFLEKPVCLTETDCCRLLDAEAQSGRSVMVGQVLRSACEYLFLKDCYDSGVYGELHSVIMQRISADVPWGFEDWFHDAEKSGSVVMDLHIHDLDFLRYMLGEPDSFSCQADALASGMVNQIVTAYRFGRVFATAEGAWDRSPNLPFAANYRACFEAATVVYNNCAAPPLTVYHKDGRIEHPALQAEYAVNDNSAGINISNLGPYYDELKYFVECLETGAPIARAPLCEAVASARLAMRELDAAKRWLNRHT